MFLSKCGEYFYIYFINPATGKRTKISTRAKKRNDAIQFLINFNPKSKIKFRNILLSEFKNEFLIYAKIHYSNSTYCLYERTLRKFISCLDDMPLIDIKLINFESYKLYRISNKASKTTVNIELRALKAIFNFAKLWGLINSNPIYGVKQFRTPQKEILAFNEAEINTLMNEIIKQPLKDFITVALFTGCRLNEITHLQWRDIDLINDEMIIRNKPDFKTKTGRIRNLPISGKLKELFTRMKENSKEADDESFLFLSPRGLPFEGNHLSGLFKNELRRLGFPERYHFHCLRHTFITQLVRKGVNIYNIKYLAGHVGIETTELYMHNITDDLRKAVELVT